MSLEQQKPNPPPSATHCATGLVGFICMLAVMWGFAHSQTNTPHNIQAILVVILVAFSMIAVDIIFFKVHRRQTTGLDWSSFNFDPGRLTVKLSGLLLTLILSAAIYWLFPEYYKNLYKPAWDILLTGLPYLTVVFCGYFLMIDGIMKDPKDGYYQAGLLALLKWNQIDYKRLGLHVRTWVIKIFFIPLMLVFLTGNMGNLQNFYERNWTEHYLDFILMIFWFFLTVDLIFTLCGYIFAFRLIDTQERSSEPTALGWIVALSCYPPFNSLLGGSYTRHGSETAWQDLTAPYPWLMIVWGGIILFLYAVYTWATVAFGCRFSNLVHRGIITNGPYRFTKHPAYISKNLSWWAMCLPFLSMGSFENCLRGTLMLLVLNGVYYMRALTEERHLARDPVYREYQDWIAKHGIFRWFPIKLHAKPLPE